ncbi:MAG: MEKHLA domain-containing protein [Sporocytophaga sp.]|uniref:MEKHLA domain-containing protein n=1 Tax=Sporocytophaga sp. TaxID=2231183 RepID=UPI001B2BDBA0|nr:MEKHLA domain-containing protein [Sporocytophaga sp.]MBO9703601.1 MEKHLA domain-containing protein [Sporocytophaga sp.]
MKIWMNPDTVKHCKLIAKNYKFWTGKELFEEKLHESELSEKMYNAPFVILSHGTQADPIYNYVNLKAQELWEYTWDEMIKLPSRRSAGTNETAQRLELIKEGQEKGITFTEKALRESCSGKKFYIKNVVLFNLLGEGGEYEGQCAIYNDWEFV